MSTQATQITNHPFEPWTSDHGWEACQHLDGIHPCGWPETEHAPAEEVAGA